MIEVKGLTRKYGSVSAIDSISFSIPKGQIVGLLGHNGAGKTTTLKVLTGYLEPTAGDVTIGGLNVETHTREIQSKIGYLSEQSPLYPEMPVWKYLEYVAELRGIEESQRQAAVTEAIEATDLGSKVAEYINTLSKGYRQRVGVAQAIIHKPEILILDEPTNGLDPTQIIAMRNLIKDLAVHSTVILSTHIMQEVEAICDRAIIILNGQIAMDSPLSELQNHNNVSLHLRESLSDLQATIGHIPGIKSIEQMGQLKNINHFKIESEDHPESLTPQVARCVIEKGWDLYRIQSEHRTLETVFKEVNSQNMGEKNV